MVSLLLNNIITFKVLYFGSDACIPLAETYISSNP